MLSRKVPPRCAVTTIIPALGGPSSTVFHSSSVKSPLPVIFAFAPSRRDRCAPALYATSLDGRKTAPRVPSFDQQESAVPDRRLAQQAPLRSPDARTPARPADPRPGGRAARGGAGGRRGASAARRPAARG